MSWKRFIIGEKMPDKADPQYKERYEKEVDAGKRFARWSRIDILAARIQQWATGHERAFLGMVFGVVIGCFVWNIIGIIRVVNAPAQGKRRNNKAQRRTAETAQQNGRSLRAEDGAYLPRRRQGNAVEKQL